MVRRRPRVTESPSLNGELDVVYNDIYEEDAKKGDPEIKIVDKNRKTSYCIEPQFETYQMYEADDGEFFLSLPAAKKYNDAINRKKEFNTLFSFDKGNLNRGQEALALEISKGNPIVDYFWILIKDDEDIKFLKDFINKHYKVLKTRITEQLKDFAFGKWSFFAITNIKKSDFNLVVTDEVSIKDRISLVELKKSELESYLPSKNFKQDVVKKNDIEINSLEAKAAKTFDKIDLG